jgi:hypothetical protein
MLLNASHIHDGGILRSKITERGEIADANPFLWDKVVYTSKRLSELFG